MIKVCHMTSAHQSNDVRIFQKMCVSLAAAGYDTYLVATGESREEKGVHVIGVGPKPATRLKRMALMARRVYKKALEVDAQIYHFHDPELLQYALKLKRKGKIVIFDSHEFYGLQIKEKIWISPPVRRFIASLYHMYETHVCRNIDAVVAVCTLDGKDYFHARSKRYEYITNAPLLSEFEDMPLLNDNHRERVLCYIGALSATRGITQLVQVAEKAKIKLKLAGNFASKKYKEALEKMPEWSYVDYMGVLSRKEVAKCMHSSSIGACVLLSKGQYNLVDTLPVKVYEYMACGLPVILNRHNYNENVIATYQFGICVDADNIDDIISAVTYLLNNPNIANKMGENGRKAVVEQFNWGVEEKKLLAFYKDLLKA